MRGGFTLLEVVVALLVLEVGVVGVLGTALVSTRVIGEAERVERATLRAAALVDSLRAEPVPGADSVPFLDGRLRWRLDDGGRLELSVRARSTRIDVTTWVRVP